MPTVMEPPLSDVCGHPGALGAGQPLTRPGTNRERDHRRRRFSCSGGTDVKRRRHWAEDEAGAILAAVWSGWGATGPGVAAPGQTVALSAVTTQLHAGATELMSLGFAGRAPAR